MDFYSHMSHGSASVREETQTGIADVLSNGLYKLPVIGGTGVSIAFHSQKWRHPPSKGFLKHLYIYMKSLGLGELLFLHKFQKTNTNTILEIMVGKKSLAVKRAY